MASCLQVENLTKSYGEQVLFENISFTIEEGRRVALVAKNGTGKTTLLNIIAGKESHDAGSVVPRRGLRIAYLEQSPAYPAGMTVLEACFHSESPALKAIAEYERAIGDASGEGLQEAMARMDALEAWDYEQRAKRILSRLKIRDFGQKVETLSGGQLKRVALANVLISESDLLILDEPTNHLDTDMTERFVDAGHLLGSASVEMWLTEGSETRKIVFSGDIGNRDQPIIRDPQYIRQADYVLTESTYGDRLHDVSEQPDYTGDLAAIIDETLSKGGNVIIPSFAVGRTQELLYFMREMKEQGMVKSVPNFQVYVDSPLAGEATRIFSGDLHGYLDEQAIQALKGGALFQFPGLNITESSEESKALNLDKSPKVIISASGMCDAGRIRHHLKHNLWRAECAVVFVGYQAEGSLGRRLLNGVSSVKLFGEEIAVRARIVNFHGLSSHADRDGLLQWIDHYQPKPRQVFVVHGDCEVTEIYADTLRQRGLPAHAPDYEEVYDLLENRVLAAGIFRQNSVLPLPLLFHS